MQILNTIDVKKYFKSCIAGACIGTVQSLLTDQSEYTAVMDLLQIMNDKGKYNHHYCYVYDDLSKDLKINDNSSDITKLTLNNTTNIFTGAIISMLGAFTYTNIDNNVFLIGLIGGVLNATIQYSIGISPNLTADMFYGMNAAIAGAQIAHEDLLYNYDYTMLMHLYA